jgi:hypothetical protein
METPDSGGVAHVVAGFVVVVNDVFDGIIIVVVGGVGIVGLIIVVVLVHITVGTRTAILQHIIVNGLPAG